ncbi:MAG: hypothetical protein WB870_09820 [Gallionellaceae bacterium]
MKNKPTKVMKFLLTIALSFVCMSPSWAGGSGPLHQDASNYFEQTLAPLLIKEKLCVSEDDCGEKHKYYFFAISLSESAH